MKILTSKTLFINKALSKPTIVAGILLSTMSPVQAENYQFTDVTAQAGVANDTQGHFGAIWADFNNDDSIDLYVVNDDENVLYRNNGDGTYANVTDPSRIADPWVAMDNVAADFDQDGDQDIYSHNFGQSTLYMNIREGRFVDRNSFSGAAQVEPHGTGAAWGDLDNDGWIDLATTSFPGQNALFRNNGDGTFTEYLDGSGMLRDSAVMGNMLGDIDKDGDLDWVGAAVTNQDSHFLYLNNGDGSFTPATESSGIVVEEGSSTAAVVLFDYDQDADLDLLITEVSLGSGKQLVNRIYLFQNDGTGKFQDVTLAAGLDIALKDKPGRGEDQAFWDATAIDINNNGLLDIYILTFQGNNRLMLNNGDGTFNSAPEFGLDTPVGGKGAAFGDMDNDGDLDVYLANRDGDDLHVPIANFLMENTGGENNWLQLELEGTCSNIDGIGAKIQMQLDRNGKHFYREVHGGRGLFSDDSRIVQIGLGTKRIAQLISITWPSGYVQQLNRLSSNQRHHIVEPEDLCSL